MKRRRKRRRRRRRRWRGRKIVKGGEFVGCTRGPRGPKNVLCSYQLNPGLSGRFSDFTYAKDQAVSYEKDTVEGTFTEVRQIRIADFIKKVVATRR